MAIKRFLGTTLLGGALAILPLAIVVVVVTWAYGFVRVFIDPLSNLLTSNSTLPAFIATLVVIGIFLAVCFFLGLFVRTRFGKRGWHGFEKRVLVRVPFYNFASTAIKQFTERERSPFKRVAFATPFGNATSVLGFVTDEYANGDLMIFVPTAPIPTSGNLYRLPPAQVRIVDTSVDVAMSAIVSCGAGASELEKQTGDKQIAAPKTES